MARSLKVFLTSDFYHVCRYSLQPRALLFVKHSQKVRLYGTTLTVKKPENEGPIYRKTDQDYKVSRKATVQTLQELLNLKTFDALAIAMDNKFFKSASRGIMRKNCALYLQKGITLETLVRYPEVLTVLDAEWKVREIQKLPYDVNEVAVLLILSNSNLLRFVLSETLASDRSESKIGILSSLLQISEQRACECIAYKQFLCQLSPSKMKKNLEILLSYGVSAENICNDLWVLKYSERTIRARLDRAKEHQIETLKTWMVRVQDQTFQIHIQRCSDNMAILGDNSLAEYLSERLECTVEFANYLIEKQPALKSRSLKKLKELIDLLYAEGFKSEQICRVPKMLIHNVETTKKRLKHLKEKNIQIDGLSMLTKSQSQYMEHYEAMIKSKNKVKPKT